jgi:hypothetical protein
MSYVGKTVRFHHRVATGVARSKPTPGGGREFIPAPTELRVDDALVLSAQPVEGETEPSLYLLYHPGTEALIGEDWKHRLTVATDVPHADHDDAVHQQYWFVEKAAVNAEGQKLRDFLLANFKSETGDETPEACAIRLLAKAKGKK